MCRLIRVVIGKPHLANTKVDLRGLGSDDPQVLAWPATLGPFTGPLSSYFMGPYGLLTSTSKNPLNPRDRCCYCWYFSRGVSLPEAVENKCLQSFVVGPDTRVR